MTASTTTAPLTADDDWWRDAVIYQVYVRSFADANGDGIGDLPGIRGPAALPARPRRGRALADPVLPLADGRRRLRRRRLPRRRPDVRQPRRLRRADRRRARARACGSSSTWCPTTPPARTRGSRGARRRRPAPPSATRYLFRDGTGADGELPPNDWESIFGGPAWTRVRRRPVVPAPVRPEQPDLNWRHPEVRAEFEDVLRFWLDRGVDGFRIDVAHGMVKADGLPDVGSTRDHRPAPGRAARQGPAALLRPGRRARDLPRLAADPGQLPGRPDGRRRGVGRRPRSGWPATSARTSCTRRSTSTSSTPPGRPTRSAR